MPDESHNPTPTPSSTPSPNLPQPDQEDTPEVLTEMERLVAEAEATAQAANTTTLREHERPCPHVDAAAIREAEAGRSTDRKCPTCLWWFCDQCESPLDPKYCHLCLPQTEGLISEPLVDAEGVQHEGRTLHPDPNARFFQPRFGTLAKIISEMSDPELEDYVKYYKELVHQAEVALDFRRVVLGTSQLEQSQRGDRKRRQLRADKTKYPVKTLTVTADGKVKKQAAPMADLVRMMEMLKALQTNRDKKAAEAKKPEVK